jgi:hypothetical protein
VIVALGPVTLPAVEEIRRIDQIAINETDLRRTPSEAKDLQFAPSTWVNRCQLSVVCASAGRRAVS